MIADVITHTHTSLEYLAHREGIKKESACGKCIEMETQLTEALIELSSAQSIIEILQKGSNMSRTPQHVSKNIPTTLHEVYQETNNNWKTVTS
jgi:bacterioferritin-associated ferredoxin